MLIKGITAYAKREEFDPHAEGSGGGAGPEGNEPQGDQGGQGEPEGEPEGSKRTDFNTLPADVQAYIRDLRNENKTHRTNLNNAKTENESFKNRMKAFFGESEDDVPVEEQLETATSAYESMAIESQITNIAYMNGVPPEKLEYFQFKMSKALNELEEGEELTEEDLEAVINECRAGTQNTMANSSIDSGNRAPSGNANDGISQEEFNRMSVVEKSVLYQKNPDLYNRLQKGFRL